MSEQEDRRDGMTNVVTILGDEIAQFFGFLGIPVLAEFSGDTTVHFAIDGGIKVKVNEGAWAPPIGDHSPVMPERKYRYAVFDRQRPESPLYTWAPSMTLQDVLADVEKLHAAWRRVGADLKDITLRRQEELPWQDVPDVPSGTEHSDDTEGVQSAP